MVSIGLICAQFQNADVAGMTLFWETAGLSCFGAGRLCGAETEIS